MFDAIQSEGDVATEEMFRVFNMGVGFCVVVSAGDVDAAVAAVAASGGSAQPIGEGVPDDRRRVWLDEHGLVGEGGRFKPTGG